MNTLRNRVQLIGNLGMDPEVKNLEKGKKVVHLSIATRDTYVNKDGEKVKETQWHNLVVWGKLCDVCEKYLKKGTEVAVDGKLTNRKWEDKDGKQHYTTEIVVNELVLLGGKGN